MEQKWQMFESAKLIFFGIASAFSALLLYLGIDREVFTIFAALIVVDFFTGIAAARTLNQHITSNRAKYGIVSKFSLLLIPVVLAAAIKAVGADAAVAFNWGIGLMVFSELYSIIGNIVTIRTKQVLPEWDALSLLARKIRERFEDEKK